MLIFKLSIHFHPKESGVFWLWLSQSFTFVTEIWHTCSLSESRVFSPESLTENSGVTVNHRVWEDGDRVEKPEDFLSAKEKKKKKKR